MTNGRDGLGFAVRRRLRVAAGTVLAAGLLASSMLLGAHPSDRRRFAAEPRLGPPPSHLSVPSGLSPLSDEFVGAVLGRGALVDRSMLDRIRLSPEGVPVPRSPDRLIVDVEPGSNDDFKDAYAVERVPFTARTDISTSSTEADERKDCDATPVATIWYRFTPTSDIRLLASTTGSDFDAVLGVWAGTEPGSLRPQACIPSEPGRPAQVLLNYTRGQTYYFQIVKRTEDLLGKSLSFLRLDPAVASQEDRVMETFAGFPLGDDGPARLASVNAPFDVATDAAGNLLVVDRGNHRVRRIDGRGVISTIAGNGTDGYSGDGGSAKRASLRFPSGVAVDPEGYVYIADRGNHVIRRVSPDGRIITIAGIGKPGFSGDDGPANRARLAAPFAVALDRAGTIYISDQGNGRIRTVDPQGTIRTVAYVGECGTAEVRDTILNVIGPPAGCYVAGLTVTPLGDRVIFADPINHAVRELAPATGVITTVAGNGSECTTGFTYGTDVRLCGDGGPSRSASLRQPFDVELDAEGNLYIADAANYVVRKVDRSGTITKIAGRYRYANSGDGGPAIEAEFGLPVSITTGLGGSLYIADIGFDSVRYIDNAGRVRRVAGGPGRDEILDGGPATRANLHEPTGVDVDASGNVYVVDAGNNRVRKIDRSRTITTLAGDGIGGFSGDGGPATSARLAYPSGVAADAEGNIFIADAENHRIRKVDRNGTISTVAGNGYVSPVVGGYGFSSGSYSGDGGPATEASLNYPADVAVDAHGNLYIADLQNNLIRKVDPNGIITTVAGNYPTVDDPYDPVYRTGAYSGDGGLATSASLNWPFAVEVDHHGNLYIVDTLNNRIRKVANGIITTVAGDGFTGAGERGRFGGDGGPAVSASLDGPTGVDVDRAGNIYIADFFNNRVRKVDSSGIMTTVAGTGPGTSTGDGGSARAATLVWPYHLVVDPSGTIYVTEWSGNRLRAARIRTLSVPNRRFPAAPPRHPGDRILSPELVRPADVYVPRYGRAGGLRFPSDASPRASRHNPGTAWPPAGLCVGLAGALGIAARRSVRRKLGPL